MEPQENVPGESGKDGSVDAGQPKMAKMVKPHLKYLWYVLRHKYYVFVECWKLGVPWLGLIHDISKFWPAEWIKYVDTFFKKQSLEKDESGFQKPKTINQMLGYAWLLHKNRNKHHWEWWVLPNGGNYPVEMKKKYMLEMIADWKGAGRAQGTPDTTKWYESNKEKIILHDNTRNQIEQILYG